jgi:peptide/nickel transport system substrate-binding protein
VAADTGYHLGRPLLDGVVWTFVPGPDAALLSVLSGEADVFENVTPDAMKRIASHETVKALAYPSPNYGYLGFNMRDPKNPDRPHALFADRGLRRALAMGIDRKTLLRNAYDSLAYLGSGPFSRLLPNADTTLAMVQFDSIGADRLLDSLGWRDGNGDGVREKAGRPLRFSILVHSTSPARRAYAELIQAQLRAHGVRVDVDAGDAATVNPRFFGGQFDALLMNWSTDPSPNAIHDNWHSPSTAQRGGNLQFYSSTAIQLLTRQSTAPSGSLTPPAAAPSIVKRTSRLSTTCRACGCSRPDNTWRSTAG